MADPGNNLKVPVSAYPDDIQIHSYHSPLAALSSQIVVGPFDRDMWLDGATLGFEDLGTSTGRDALLLRMSAGRSVAVGSACAPSAFVTVLMLTALSNATTAIVDGVTVASAFKDRGAPFPFVSAATDNKLPRGATYVLRFNGTTFADYVGIHLTARLRSNPG